MADLSIPFFFSFLFCPGIEKRLKREIAKVDSERRFRKKGLESGPKSDFFFVRRQDLSVFDDDKGDIFSFLR